MSKRRRPSEDAQPVHYPPPGEQPPAPAPVPRDDDDGPDATLDSRFDEKIYGNACIGLVRRAWGLPTAWKFDRPEQQGIDRHDGDRGSTPNKRGMFRVWDYGSAVEASRGPRGAVVAEARERLIDFFVKQRTTEGHQWAEFNTSSHGQFWPLIAASAHALALHYEDSALLEETGEWWRREADLCDKLLDPDRHRTGPCGRSAGATFDIGTVIAHLLRGTEPPEYSLLPNAKGGRRKLVGPDFYEDSYNAGPWMVKELIERGDTLGGATKGQRSPVVARDPLYIYRRGHESVKVVPFARSSEYCFWCAQLDSPPSVECIETSPGRYEAPHSGGRFPQGRENPYPAPVLEGAQLTIIEGVP